MTDEVHVYRQQLMLVRDNLFRGLSKSMQKLQAKSINEVLGIPNYVHQQVSTTEEYRRKVVAEVNEFIKNGYCRDFGVGWRDDLVSEINREFDIPVDKASFVKIVKVDNNG